VPNDPVLIGQLAGRKYDVTEKGRIKVESKKDMAARGEPSPDRADTLVMAMETRGHRYADAIVHFDPIALGPSLSQDVMTHALAVGLVRDLGGHVEVVNTDTGARVLVALPRATEEVVAAQRPPSQPSPSLATSPALVPPRPAGEGLARVLVVDDEAFILELSERALMDVCKVTTVGSADGAQALLEVETFDLIVTDLRMPGALDGLGLYEWVKVSRPDLASHFVFTTADTVSRQTTEFLMTAGRPYLQKPFDVRNYRRFISDELDRVRSSEAG
ncbi:MAG: response regulator, partial [Myxococcota bacterium]|nr:response regulator [Myxococcota bacterium]